MNISLNNITKKYGSITVLDQISAEFTTGTITGLIGRNGSGKTMILKALCGLIKLDEGTISVEGTVVENLCRTNYFVGAIIESPGFLSQYSGYKNLSFLAMIRKKIGRKDIENAMRLVDLDYKEKKVVGKYSLGMRQRLGIAQVLMEDPDILLLDEPMNGLDNSGVEKMQQLFLQLKKAGKTIIIASHSKEDIMLLCDSVIEMDHGKVISTYSQSKSIE